MTDLEKKPRVLLVDDDKIILSMYKDYLEKHDFEVVPENNAISAIGRLSGGEVFDLVITDIMMAKVDGWELLDTIRKTLEIDETVLPVIIITAFEETGLETKAWRNGAAAVFLKGKQPLSGLVREARIQTGRARSKYHDTE